MLVFPINSLLLHYDNTATGVVSSSTSLSAEEEEDATVAHFNKSQNRELDCSSSH